MSSPAVMFEIMALNQPTLIEFYARVFGWRVEFGSEGFGYIHFPPAPPASYRLLGGIGQAKPGVTGWGKGITFYLQVESLDDTLAKVVAHGGAIALKPVVADGYHFAMFEDPECNLIGLIKPIPK